MQSAGNDIEQNMKLKKKNMIMIGPKIMILMFCLIFKQRNC